MSRPRARYYALILRGQEEQEARSLEASGEEEARREAARLAGSLDEECTVVLFREKRPAPLMAWKRLANGGLIEGLVKAD